MCLTHIKIGYFCLLSSIILKNISLGHATRKYHILKLGSSKLARILSQLLLFLLIINFLLIGIINPGMLNPGPGSLKICYQNVQGLIPIKDLTLKGVLTYFWQIFGQQIILEGHYRNLRHHFFCVFSNSVFVYM